MTEMTLNQVNDVKLQPQTPGKLPGKLFGWMEVFGVALLMPVGAILGSLTGIAPLASICAVLLPLIAATFFLRSEGVSWHSLVFGTRLTVSQILAYAAVALVGGYFVVLGMTWLLQNFAGMPKIDVSRFETLLAGNLTMYLVYLIPVAWGSAAIGEELLARGFLQHRLEGLTNLPLAAVFQAGIFAGAHFYQGITGMVAVFLLALIFTTVYVRSGRNLITVIIAHGVIDTIALTLLYFGRSDLLIGT